MTTIGDVENAMLARITAASADAIIPYTYRTLETWPRDFDAYLNSEVVGYPACWAVFAGAHKVERAHSGLWRAECAFGEATQAARSVRR